MKKIVVVLLLVFVAGCGTFTYRTEGPPIIEAASPIVMTDVVRRGDVMHKEVHSGVVRLVSRPLFFDMEEDDVAMFGEFYVRVGEAVQEGQLLARLDVEHIHEQIDEKRDMIAQMRRTNELNNNRQSLTIASMVLEHTELVQRAAQTLDLDLFASADRLEASIQMRQITLQHTMELQSLELQDANRLLASTIRLLDGTALYAPHDGIFTQARVSRGDRIDRETTIMYISVIERPIVQYVGTAVLLQDMHDFVKIRAYINGMPIGLEFADITPEEREFYTVHNGRYRPNLRAVFPIRFNINPGYNPPLGSFVNLYFYHVFEEDVLRLPRTALFFDRHGDYVLRIVNGNQEQVHVEAIHTPTYIVIQSGLEEGDVVFVRR